MLLGSLDSDQRRVVAVIQASIYRTNFEGAVNYCENLGGTVASIHSQEEADYLWDTFGEFS